MFEKEAEEYATTGYEKKLLTKEQLTVLKCARYDGFQKGAEFGYKLAHEEINYLNKHWRSEEERKANEWHYVKDGNPDNENDILCQISKDEVEVGYYHTKNKRYYTIDGYPIDVIRWKEIVLPELPTELSKKWVDNYEDYQNASNDITFSQYPVYRGK